ncbi:SDR family oxidoreductase [Glaciecola sp. MH2013]|uniref:SDR family NAD(P)-dependent oxidoreductase n=1 Tax=Glaciecola sp. MH2013 TaxID=2785524 RepID=UPI00189C9D24|nr:SDR family oxidoreductase [Glaciecola sp. MH2013]MBF7073450.1 SDR family oxidoreductase [Glaciecola sp. MH2013]
MKKNVVITGASSGIGLAIAKKFLDEGHRVFNLDIQQGEYGEFIACDMTQHEEVQQALAQILSSPDLGAIDVLVCNAGKHLSANIEDTSEQAFLDLFNLNVKGAFSATQAVLPSMRAQQSGSIVYIASDQAIIGKTNSFAYNLSKHALASMAKTTALDYAKYNIRANAICPGTIETPLYHQAIDKYCAQSGVDKALVHKEEGNEQPIGRIGQAHEVASLCYFIASEEAAFITGSLQVIDGGYTTK